MSLYVTLGLDYLSKITSYLCHKVQCGIVTPNIPQISLYSHTQTHTDTDTHTHTHTQRKGEQTSSTRHCMR